MNTPEEETADLPLSFRRKGRRNRLLIATAVAVLGAGVVFLGIRSPFASAAPQSVPPPSATAPTIQDSQQWHPADASADVGPGQCEPCVVGTR